MAPSFARSATAAELPAGNAREQSANERQDVGHGQDLLVRICCARFAMLIMIVVLLGMLPWAVMRAVTDQGSDVYDFVRSSRFIVVHGTRNPCTAFNRYLPSVDVAFILFTLAPLAVVATAYCLFNIGTWFALLSTVRDRLLPPRNPSVASRGTMAAALMVLVIAADGFMIGAFHVLMVWLMVAGLVHASRGRDWKGGALLGVATWIKLLPVIGVGYLLLKRKWKAALIALAVVAAIDIPLSLAAFGWQGTWHEHAAFLHGGAMGTLQDQMHGEAWIDEDRITNQSTIVVLRRLLTARAGQTSMAVADLSPQGLSIVTGCVLAGLAAGIATLLRRPGAALSQEEWAGEIALLLLGTVWFSPVVWSYHLTAVLPALAVIMAQDRYEAPKQIVTIAWIVGLALFAVPLGRAAGHMLLTSYLIGAVLLWTLSSRGQLAPMAVGLSFGLRGPRRPAHHRPRGAFATSRDSGAKSPSSATPEIFLVG
ncbi:MAG TPA: glycosyltransferase family 87 protein [Pirellulales bacterium]|nr:glycosyltransferase family 87 protein [Pirellulales bacterium]